MNRVRNDANVFNARLGMIGNQVYTITHRNPTSGDLWVEDMPNGKDERGKYLYGKWVPGEKVKFAGETL